MALCPEDSQRTIDKATELPFSEAQVAGVVERYLETNGFVQSLEAFRRENVHLSGDRGSAFEVISNLDNVLHFEMDFLFSLVVVCSKYLWLTT